MAKESNATWINLDITSLSGEAQDAYEVYKDASRRAADLRTKFEAMVNDESELPEGKKLVFGYRFGKLSAAIVDDDRKPAKASPAKQSLSEFLASQRAAGART